MKKKQAIYFKMCFFYISLIAKKNGLLYFLVFHVGEYHIEEFDLSKWIRTDLMIYPPKP